MANASLSNYPTSVDTFDRISDLDENTLKKSNQYKKLVNVGNYAGAKAYLNDVENADLKQCAINAEIVNKHSDAIVAIENDIKSNVKSDISDIVDKVHDNEQLYNRKISDIENKLGYNISNATDGVSLTINKKTPISIKGSGKTKVYDYNNSGNNITISTPEFIYEPVSAEVKYDKSLHFSGSLTNDLYEACFYHSRSEFINFTSSVKCKVNGTDWRDPNGNTTMTSEYYPFAVEGGIRTTQNIWYPFGYNSGSRSVNAYFDRYSSDSDRMELIVECTGISIDNIECTCGIIKYYIGRKY